MCDFSITVVIKVIMFNGYIKLNGTLIINKYKRSRLTFDLSANVTQIGLPSICSYVHTIFFSETTGSAKVKFHMEHPLNEKT